MARKDGKDRGIFFKAHPNGAVVHDGVRGDWWARYFDQFGKEHKEKCGRKKLAEQVYAKRKTEIREGRFFPKERRKPITFTTVLEDYLAYCDRRGKWVMSRGTRKTAKTRMLAAFGDREAEKIRRPEIEGFLLGLTELEDPLMVSSTNRYLTVIRAAYNYALARDTVKVNPTRGIKKAKENNMRTRYLTEEEEVRLFEALPVSYHPLVITALYTGMRQGELFDLRWPAVDFYAGIVEVRKSKSGEGRRIPMNPKLRETLKSHREQSIARARKSNDGRELFSQYVFHSPKGEYLRNFARVWKPAVVEKAKIPDFHFHDLRHTFASRLMMNGADLYEVMTLLGHKTLVMTQRYAHLAPEGLRRAVERLA